MTRMRMAFALIGILAMLPLGAACSREPEAPGRAWTEDAPDSLEPLPIGGDFTLTDTDGRPFSLADHRGKAVVLFFGFASCPDFCPAAMSKVKAALGELGEDRSRVLTVFVSVDPERDTPEVLRAYLGNFGIDAVGVTGSHEELQKVARQYAAHYEKEETGSAMGYQVVHTTYLFVLDPQGRVRRLIRHDEPAEVLARTLERLLDGA
ncbi:MAG TPA: SCO family protein [Vicinamibacterales bacterium]